MADLDLANNLEENLDDEEIDVVDLDGEDFVIIADADFEGETYFALVPYDQYVKADEEDGDDDEDVDFIVLRAKEDGENGEYELSTIDDDELSDKVGNMFLKMFEEAEED